MSRRGYSNVASPVYLVSGLDGDAGTTSSTFSVAATPGGSAATPIGWPATVPFFAVLDQGTAGEELVLVTAVSGASLTATRGVALGTQGYGASNKVHQAGAELAHVAAAADFDEANAHVNATQAVHGLAAGSAVVGLNDVQTLLNKTLSSTTGVSGGGTVVSTTGTQTLSNKTLADPVATGTVTAPNLRLTGTGAASLSGTGHPFQVGSSTGANIRLDGNDIIAANNGVAADLAVQSTGGTITVGGAATFNSTLVAKAAFQASVKQCAVTTGGTAVTVPVTFSQAFSAAPVVTVSPDTGTSQVTQCNVANVTTTGFNIVFNRTSTTSTGVHWQAMLATQASS